MYGNDNNNPQKYRSNNPFGTSSGMSNNGQNNNGQNNNQNNDYLNNQNMNNMAPGGQRGNMNNQNFGYNNQMGHRPGNNHGYNSSSSNSRIPGGPLINFPRDMSDALNDIRPHGNRQPYNQPIGRPGNNYYGDPDYTPRPSINPIGAERTRPGVNYPIQNPRMIRPPYRPNVYRYPSDPGDQYQNPSFNPNEYPRSRNQPNTRVPSQPFNPNTTPSIGPNNDRTNTGQAPGPIGPPRRPVYNDPLIFNPTIQPKNTSIGPSGDAPSDINETNTTTSKIHSLTPVGKSIQPPSPPTDPSIPGYIPTPEPSNINFISTFEQPRRPNQGQLGRPIMLRANFFKVEMPSADIFHYDISITPDKCPRRVNREIIETMVKRFQANIFSERRPVYDGRKNLYTTKPLPIDKVKYDLDVSLPSDGKDRVFKVSIKFKSKVSLYQLKVALGENGKNTEIPFESVQALDVVMRHLPSMTYTPVGRSFFSQPTSRNRVAVLGGGREVWFGYHQSMRPSQWKMMLNIDVSATAFYKSQPVIKFLVEVLEFRSEEDLRSVRA